MIKTILEATDGSDSGTRAVQFAAEAAARYTSKTATIRQVAEKFPDRADILAPSSGCVPNKRPLRVKTILPTRAPEASV